MADPVADPVAEVLAEVANVLYGHRYGYWTDEHGWEWAGCQGCEWGRDVRIARGPGYDAHRLHQAEMLAAAGLVVETTTEWGVRWANGQVVGPMAEAETRAWKSGDPVHREVTAWVPADEGGSR